MTKSGPFEPNSPHKTLFLAHFVAKSGPFVSFGRVRRTPAPPPSTLATGLGHMRMHLLIRLYLICEVHCMK